MPRAIAIGAQGFADIRERGCFLIDKTGFIRDWWRSADSVTLICRPRRFGKTLNLSMVECFLSTRYADRGDLFDGLAVWDDPAMRAEQGRWPVISLSLADVKAASYAEMRDAVRLKLARLRDSLIADGLLDPVLAAELDAVAGIAPDMDDALAKGALNALCEALHRQTGRKALVLLDEYDTPLQEAWLDGYWAEAAELMRGLLNSTFKTNPCLERGLITGITRVARESIFSDLNNLKVVTTTTNKYETCFGFTEAEVFAAMDEFGMADREGVKRWYDGFTFGRVSGIYNPWSITNYLDEGELAPYWANTSGNGLVSKIVREGDADLKADFEELMNGGTVRSSLDEQVVFSELGERPGAIWALLLASGYLKVVSKEPATEDSGPVYELALTNTEVRLSFDGMVRGWFGAVGSRYNGFVRALLAGDVPAMNAYMNDVALDTFSTFDTGNRPSGAEPERFYHGFVLGLLVELRGRYRVLSNRESGYGRCDALLVPRDPARDPGVVLEFKARDAAAGEGCLEDTLAAAHAQIEARRYAEELERAGVPAERVRAYGLAFEGKRVLIG